MYLAYIGACTLVIYQGTFCILPFNCVCNETLALIALGIKNKKIAIYFSFFRWSVEGRGEGIRPATAVPPPVDAQELPTERPLNVLRLKCTSRETVSSQVMRWL